jgi:hypothetical protein
MGTGKLGLPVTEATNGRGIAVTKVTAFGMPVVFDTIGVAPPLVPATFNGTPSASVVVSNGGLTVTHGSTNNGAGVFSASPQSSGKFYFEVQTQTSIATGHGIGIRVYAGGVFSDPGGGFQNGVGVIVGAACNIWANNVNTTKNLGAQAIGSVFCGAIDLTARLAWYRLNGGNWNADVAANPATGANGVVIPAGAMAPQVRFTNTGITDAFVGNFGQSAFAQAVPAGFTSGWPA